MIQEHTTGSYWVRDQSAILQEHTMGPGDPSEVLPVANIFDTLAFLWVVSVRNILFYSQFGSGDKISDVTYFGLLWLP